VSVERLMELTKVFDECHEKPVAWLIRGRPFDKPPTMLLPIALFDTKEQAEAYISASRLPMPKKLPDGTPVYFLANSALDNVDYIDPNFVVHGHPAVIPAYPWMDYGSVPCNPEIPSHIMLTGV
jgi:hypothetical protein